MERKQTEIQHKTYEVIFGTETRWGRNFDLMLILAILVSVAVILLDSIPAAVSARSSVRSTKPCVTYLAVDLQTTNARFARYSSMAACLVGEPVR